MCIMQTSPLSIFPYKRLISLNCRIPQRHDNGKNINSYQLIDATHDKTHMRESLDKTALHNH